MASIVASAGRARIARAAALRPHPHPSFRTFASTALRRTEQDDPQQPQNAPRPPPPIDDSTSALDYKRTLRHRPPPLPAMDLPRSRTAEEAVTNILYNTPPPSLQPFKKCVASFLFSFSSYSDAVELVEEAS